MIEVVAGAVISSADGRALLVRKYGTESFMNPGGKPEPGEMPQQTLRRELFEELSIEVPEDEMERWGTHLTEAANEPGELLRAVCFLVRLAYPTHRIGSEIAESRWVNPAQPEKLADKLVLAPLAERYLLPRIASINF